MKWTSVPPPLPFRSSDHRPGRVFGQYPQIRGGGAVGGAPGARTQNPRIKSPLLYH